MQNTDNTSHRAPTNLNELKEFARYRKHAHTTLTRTYGAINMRQHAINMRQPAINMRQHVTIHCYLRCCTIRKVRLNIQASSTSREQHPDNAGFFSSFFLKKNRSCCGRGGRLLHRARVSSNPNSPLDGVDSDAYFLTLC